MGYGQATSQAGKRKTRKTATRVYKSRYKNHSIDRKMRKPKRTTVDKRQTAAIRALGRQVKSLAMSQFGDKQYQYQYLSLTPTANNRQSFPSRQRPIFFAANSFYDKTSIFRGFIQTTGPSTGLSGYEAIAENSINVTFKKHIWDIDTDNRYQWNVTNAQNTVSKISYMPIFMKYKFLFDYELPANYKDQRYRITLFQMKHMPMASDKKDYTIPGAAGAYSHMCCSRLESRNYFSKSYHKVLVDKWVTIKSKPDVVAKGLKTVEIPFAFKAQVLQPNLSADPAGQLFWTNLAEEDVIWCLVSSDEDMQDFVITGGRQTNLSIQRSLTWRDKHDTTPYAADVTFRL